MIITLVVDTASL